MNGLTPVISQHITGLTASAGTSVRSLSDHFLLVNYGTLCRLFGCKIFMLLWLFSTQKLLCDVNAANGGATRLQIGSIRRPLSVLRELERRLPSFPQKAAGKLRTGLLLILSARSPSMHRCVLLESARQARLLQNRRITFSVEDLGHAALDKC